MSTITIKKQFTSIHSLLLENKGKKLTKDLVSQFEQLMMSKVMSSTFKKDEKGAVTHVYCYYHKEWEDVTVVEYGKKSSTSTGLNSMCKAGTSRWTKQQRVMKQAKAELLEQVSNGEVEASDLLTLIEEIELKSKEIVPLGEVDETNRLSPTTQQADDDEPPY